MKLRRLEDVPALVHGKKVVLANGCFDILHVGHVRYLQHARKMGDVLVVAINSDKSMGLIKDPGRPILGERERVSLVSALRPVDHVVLFDEPDVSRVLDVLRRTTREGSCLRRGSSDCRRSEESLDSRYH